MLVASGGVTDTLSSHFPFDRTLAASCGVPDALCTYFSNCENVCNKQWGFCGVLFFKISICEKACHKQWGS